MSTPIEPIGEGEAQQVGDDKEHKRFLRRMGRLCRTCTDEYREMMLGADPRIHGATHRIRRVDLTLSESIAALEPLAKTSETARNRLTTALSIALGHYARKHGDIRTAAAAYGYVCRQNDLILTWDPCEIPNVFRTFQELAQKRDEDPAVRADALVIQAFLLFFDFGQIQNAMLALHMAQHLLPQDGALHTCKGYLLTKQGEGSQAIVAFTRAAELGCDNIDCMLFHQGMLAEDDKQGIAWLEEYV